MPIQVDIAERKHDIAEATFRVAAENGLEGVTIRSVAAELGASTTVITNYLPSRAELLVNAVDLLGDEWVIQLEKIHADGGDDVILRAMRASVGWDDAEQIRCQFWVDLLTAPGRAGQVDDHLRKTAQRVRSIVEDMLVDIGHREPGVTADLLFLFAQGVFVSIVEDPGSWPPERVIAAAERLVDLV